MADNTEQAPALTRFCTERPWLVVIVVAAVTALFGFYALDIQRDHSNEKLLPEDEPIREIYDEFKTYFDIKAKVALGVETEEGVFTPEVLAQISRLSDALDEREDLEEVQSLTTIENITAIDGEIIAGPLAEDLPTTPEQIADLRQQALGNRMIAEGLVSADQRSTVIVAQPTFETFETDKAAAAYDAIKQLVADDPGPATVHVAGFPMVVGLTDSYMDRDNRVMLPAIVVMVILLLFVAFRSARGVWIPLAVVVAATVWTFGILALWEVKITIIATSIPIVLVAMGIADGIHVIHEYYHHLRRGTDNLSAVRLTMAEMNAPVIMTSLTTSVGFLALASSDITPIQEYGVAVAIGVMAAMVFSLTFIPACLVLLGKPKNVLSERVAERGLLHNLGGRIAGFSLRHGKPIILFFAVGLAITSAIASQLRARNNPVEYFRESSEIRQATDFLNREFSGTGDIFVQVDGGKEDAFKNPVLLDRVYRFQRRLEALPLVGTSRSLADFLARMHFVLHDEDPSYDRVPGTADDLPPDAGPLAGRRLIGQYLLLYEIAGGSELSRTVDDTYQRANIELSIKSNASTDYEPVLARVHAAAAEIFTGGEIIGETGSGVITLKVVQYLVLGQVFSLALSFGVVFLMLILLFRSLGLALIGVIPLAITVATNFAFMVVTGIPLNMGTALIASVCIGIGVDYSIHFITRYRIERQRESDLEAAVRATMATSGRAIFLNAAAVGGGFAVLLFSSFMPIIYLGVLMPLIMAGNACAAIVIIPSFLNVMSRFREKTSRPTVP